MNSYEMRKSIFSFYFSKNTNYEAHLHKEVEILYVIAGQHTVQSNFAQYILNPGDLYISFPNTVHECKSEVNSSSLLWIFNSDIIRDFSSEINRKTPITPILRKAQLHDDILYAISAFSNRDILNEDCLLCRAFLSLMMSHILDNLDYKYISINNNEDWMFSLLIYLNERYGDSLSLDKISSHIGVSRYHLSRTFSAKMGCSIPDYINKLRVAKAIELLKHTDNTVTEIAYSSGFESMPTFFRAFKKNGLPSPKIIRKSNI